MQIDFEKQLQQLAEQLKQKVSAYESGRSAASGSKSTPFSAEDRAFFETIRRLTPQFDSIQSMFNRWQELAGLK